MVIRILLFITILFCSHYALAAPIQMQFDGNFSLQKQLNFSIVVDYDSGLQPKTYSELGITEPVSLFPEVENGRYYTDLSGTLTVSGRTVGITGLNMIVVPSTSTSSFGTDQIRLNFARGNFDLPLFVDGALTDDNGDLISQDIEEALWTDIFGRPGAVGSIYDGLLRSLNMRFFVRKDDPNFPLDSLPSSPEALDGLIQSARISYTRASSLDNTNTRNSGFNVSGDSFVDLGFGLSVSCVTTDCGDDSSTVTVSAPAMALLMIPGVLLLMGSRKMRKA